MKKAVIIGGSSGIGEELARLLDEAGYTVLITGRREDLLQQISASGSRKILHSVFDVTDTEVIENRLEEAVTKLGGCDLFVISAGTGDINNALEYSIDDNIINTNIQGFTATANWAFRFYMKQGYGHLAAITSVAGIRGFRGAQSYNASKAYQINFLQALNHKSRKEKLNIIITELRPGFVNTKMAKGPGRFWVSSPQKAASQILKALKRKRNVVYITRRWRLIGILMKLMPKFLYHRL